MCKLDVERSVCWSVCVGGGVLGQACVQNKIIVTQLTYTSDVYAREANGNTHTQLISDEEV